MGKRKIVRNNDSIIIVYEGQNNKIDLQKRPPRLCPSKKAKSECYESEIFMCHECGLTFDVIDSLNFHMQTVHSAPTFITTNLPELEVAHQPDEFETEWRQPEIGKPDSYTVTSPEKNEVQQFLSQDCEQVNMVGCDSLLQLICEPSPDHCVPSAPESTTQQPQGLYVFPVESSNTSSTSTSSQEETGKEQVMAPTAKKSSTGGRRKDSCNCPVCGQEFSNQGSYRNHLEIHEGKRPYVCPLCSRGYVNEIKLLEHFSRHSNEGAFKCRGCGKVYKTQRGLSNHQNLKCNIPL